MKTTEIQRLIDEIAGQNLPRHLLFEKLDGVKELLSYASKDTAMAYVDYILEVCNLPGEYRSPILKDVNARQKENKPTKNDGADKKLCASFEELVEIVLSDGKISYLIKDDGELKILDEYDHPIKGMITPPDLNDIPYPVMVADLIIVHTSDEDSKLYADVFQRLQEIAVLPSENHYHLCTIFIFSTYLVEALPYYAYIWFYAIPERGKSRIVKALSHLSYRGLYSETLNEAYIFRYADLFQGTLALDVYELVTKAHKRGSHDLLLGRYEKGMKIPRVVAHDKGDFKDTRYYNVSGPTILATNTDIPARDPLRSRCIKITMPEARGIYPNNNSPENLQDLKIRLLAFRYRHLNNPLPEIEKPIQGRLGDIIHPLFLTATLLPDESLKGLNDLIQAIENERKEAESESLSGRIAQALFDLQHKVSGGKLPIKLIREIINEDVDERYQIAPVTIGRELTAMDLEKDRTTGGERCVVWDDEKVMRIFSRYDLVDSHLSHLSHQNDEKVTEVTEVTRNPDGKEKKMDIPLWQQLRFDSEEEYTKMINQ